MNRAAPASPQLRASADDWLNALKQAFLELDHAQQTMRGYVEVFTTNLPDRVERSGLVPRFRTLDAETVSLFEEYLALLDRQPDVSVLDGSTLYALVQSSMQLYGRLNEKGQQLDQFVNDYDAELQRVAVRVKEVEGLRARSERALAAAHQFWQQLRDHGFEAPSTDTALAKARVAARGVTAWQPTEGVRRLEELVVLVEGFADELHRAADEFPQKVAKLQTRVPSLRTRLEAIANRSERMEEHLGVLRREFALANWADLEDGSRAIPARRAEVGARLDCLQAELDSGAWATALAELVTVEESLEQLDDVVDGPHDRLELVRALQANPAGRLERTRFAVKDAQVMVVTGRVREADDLGRRLDALAFRASGAAPLLGSANPDYLTFVRTLEQVEAEVREVVREYRARAGGTPAG